MALTPDNVVILDESESVEDAQLPSKTWAIDFENGRIGGFIDGDLALRQSVKKALYTERNKYPIYSDAYGNELQDLIGQGLTSGFLNAEVPRMVEEALIYDDRITDVSTSHEINGDELKINVSVNGSVSEVVKINGI